MHPSFESWSSWVWLVLKITTLFALGCWFFSPFFLFSFIKSVPISRTIWFSHIYTYFSLWQVYWTQVNDGDSGLNADIAQFWRWWFLYTWISELFLRLFNAVKAVPSRSWGGNRNEKKIKSTHSLHSSYHLVHHLLNLSCPFPPLLYLHVSLL